MLAPSFLLAAAVLAGTPNLPPPAAAPAGEESRQPTPDEGQGGPYEPVEEQDVIVEAEPAEAERPFMLAPDPELERRYAPRARQPLNRIRIEFQAIPEENEPCAPSILSLRRSSRLSR